MNFTLQALTYRTLHEESIQHGPIIAVVVKSIDQRLILQRLRSVGAPYDPLMQVSDADTIILVVELEHERIEALGHVIHRPRVRGVQDGGCSAVRHGHIDVPLRYRPAGGTVAIHTHGTKVYDVGIYFALDDST